MGEELWVRTGWLLEGGGLHARPPRLLLSPRPSQGHTPSRRTPTHTCLWRQQGAGRAPGRRQGSAHPPGRGSATHSPSRPPSPATGGLRPRGPAPSLPTRPTPPGQPRTLPSAAGRRPCANPPRRPLPAQPTAPDQRRCRAAALTTAHITGDEHTFARARARTRSPRGAPGATAGRSLRCLRRLSPGEGESVQIPGIATVRSPTEPVCATCSC